MNLDLDKLLNFENMVLGVCHCKEGFYDNG